MVFCLWGVKPKSGAHSLPSSYRSFAVLYTCFSALRLHVSNLVESGIPVHGLAVYECVFIKETSTATSTTTFGGIPLDSSLLARVRMMGARPLPIQQAAMSRVFASLAIHSQTGSGKTLSFMSPGRAAAGARVRAHS
jgi:hypothetical protein